MVIKIMFYLYVLIVVYCIGKRFVELREADYNLDLVSENETESMIAEIEKIKMYGFSLRKIITINLSFVFMLHLLFMSIYVYAFVNFPIMKTLSVLQMGTLILTYVNMSESLKLAYDNEKRELFKFFKVYNYEFLFNLVLDLVFIFVFFREMMN